MRILKNTETKKPILYSLAATVLFAAFAYAAKGLASALFVLLCSFCIIVIFSYVNELRYKKLSEMTTAIDSILHGADVDLISDYAEGELSALQSEIKKMTVRLRQNADALKKDKLFLTDSIADISHQLRTPLTSMNLMLEALSAPDITFEKRLRTAYELKRLVSRIDRLIEALLKISKIDSGTARFEKKEVLLRDLINQATLPLSATLDIRAQQLKVSVADESVVCDPSWTAEALLNVIKNCIEHNPDGKSLYITVTRTAIFTQITVEDEGDGIDKQDLAHIFERFYKSKSQKTDGFGIGLHLARTIMTEQNGTIKAENRKEGGARFILRFY